MSWDIFVQDLPADAKTLEEITGDFKPKPIGLRNEIIAKIKEVVPSADFADPSWGLIDGGDFSIEVNVGNDEPTTSFAFHVRGGDAAIGVVAAILKHLGLRAIDCQTSCFFEPGAEATKSFQAWRAYRDRVVGDKGE